MKRILKVLICLAPVLSGACDRELVSDSDEQCTLMVTAVPDGRTKVTGVDTDSEDAINSIQVFVFRPEGEIETYSSSVGHSTEVVCGRGRRKIWILANAPAMSAIGSLDELRNAISHLDDNRPDGLVMAGDGTFELNSGETVSVTVSRLCAKILLKSVTKSFNSPVLQSKSLVINRIYVTNVVSEVSYSGVPSSSVWQNRTGWSHGCSSLICDEIGVTVSPKYENTHTFYVYPNSFSCDIRGGNWSPRGTRLVIDTSLDGKQYFYVVDIPDIQRNTAYVVSDLMLTRMGSDDEEHISGPSGLQVNVQVVPWSESEAYQEFL